MEINDFKDIDICTIIKTCAKSGVTKLEMGLLKIDFQKKRFFGSSCFCETEPDSSFGGNSRGQGISLGVRRDSDYDG